MSQVDWVGEQPRKPFKDIRNQRDSTAEEKAKLLLALGELINTIPPKIKGGGPVNDVREWKRVRGECAKVAGNARASVPDITAAISNMRRVCG